MNNIVKLIHHIRNYHYLCTSDMILDKSELLLCCNVLQFEISCAVEAIKEGDVYSIDADACIDCGACEATCPNEAITEA